MQRVALDTASHIQVAHSSVSPCSCPYAALAHSARSACDAEHPARFAQPRSRSLARRLAAPSHAGAQWRRQSVTAGAAGPGGNVLDKPKVTDPGVGEKNVTKKKNAPRYRLMLHNDSFNRREYVVKVLLKVVDVLTMADAVNIMNKAHIDGLACVISCPQEDAENYCEGLRGNGLISSVEPDG